MVIEDSEILEEFENFGITVKDSDVIDKLKEICMCYHLSSETIVTEWMAFRCSNNGAELTLDTLEHFERVNLNKKTGKTARGLKSQNNHVVYDISTIQSCPMDYDDDILDAYSTPDSKSSKKRFISPNTNSSKKLALNGRIPLVFSPASFSPMSVTPSQKYSSRNTAGTAVCHFRSADGISWIQQNHQVCTVKLFEENNALRKNYKFMFEKLKSRASVLNNLLEDMGEVLLKHYKFDEISPLHIPSPEQITVIGKIVSESNSKLVLDAVSLEGSLDICGGKKVSLDLRHLDQCSLFPGQIIALQGINNNGKKLVVNKIYQGIMLPFFKPELQELTSNGSCHVIIAAGPFTTLDSLSYEPLNDLMQYVIKHQPDVCILIGPFVDSKHEQIEKCTLDMTFEELFEKQMNAICKVAEQYPTQFVIIPSLRDVHHDFIYPVPPFSLLHSAKKSPQTKVHFFSDPSLITIRGIVFGITSTDILFHLGKEEAFMSSNSSDRLARLVEHILSQHSFYPLCPPAEDVNIDYEYFEQYAKFFNTPHVLILPSDLKSFIKDVNGCCCINPERLTKGLVGGTFARLLINPPENTMSTSDSIIQLISAQIVRI